MQNGDDVIIAVAPVGKEMDKFLFGCDGIQIMRGLLSAEAAVQVGTDGGVAGIAGELEVLRSARDRLAKKLATVERTYAALEKSTDTVSARLDSTIDQLKSVLDS